MNDVRDFLGWRVEDRPVPGPAVAKNIVGTLAERLVVRAIGARIWDSGLPPFYVPKDVTAEIDGSPYGLVPDAWWPPHSGLLEVKCGAARFFTTARQWRAYQWVRDTQGSKLPIERPRVFYAFVAYRLPQLTRRYAGAHDVINDVLSGIRYVLVVDSRLVEAYLTQHGTYQRDLVGRLSHELGHWDAHWNIRAHQLQPWASRPRELLQERGLRRWSSEDLGPALEGVRTELTGAGWHSLAHVPAAVIMPRRRPRVGNEDIPGSQTQLFGDLRCPACGYWAQVATCPNCAAFTPF